MNSGSPLFLTVDLVLEIHQEMIRLYGGTLGMREPGLVESAVAQGQNVYCYDNGDLFEVAAAYAYHLAESQAFLDGNKRTGAASSLTFLEINNVDVSRMTTHQVYEMMIKVALKELDRKSLAVLLRTALT